MAVLYRVVHTKKIEVLPYQVTIQIFGGVLLLSAHCICGHKTSFIYTTCSTQLLILLARNKLCTLFVLVQYRIYLFDVAEEKRCCCCAYCKRVLFVRVCSLDQFRSLCIGKSFPHVHTPHVYMLYATHIIANNSQLQQKCSHTVWAASSSISRDNPIH